MDSSDPLDDFLCRLPARIISNPRKLLRKLRQAYPIGVPALIIKSQTDRLGLAAGYAFHLGTPDENLRRIASWMITAAGRSHRGLLRIIPSLWKRHGREDLALAALLLSNCQLPVGIDAWEIILPCLQTQEAADGLLLVIEELFRAGHTVPAVSRLEKWVEEGNTQAHFALLVFHAAWIRDGRKELDSQALRMVQRIVLPEDGDLLTRVRTQLFQAG